MVAEEGREWKAFIDCSKRNCDGELMIKLSILDKFRAYYTYRCSQCNQTGAWKDLIRGIKYERRNKY